MGPSKLTGIVLAVALLGVACATTEPITVNSGEFGDEWPFHAESATLFCEGPRAIWAEIDGKFYALNALAPGWVEGHHPEISLGDLEKIWRDDPNSPGNKADLGPAMDRAFEVCDG